MGRNLLKEALSKKTKERRLDTRKTRGDGVPVSFKDWFKPFPHQLSAVKKLLGNDGSMVMAHEMGTGKTVTSIYGIELLKAKGKAGNALIVVPSGLRENYAKQGLEKFLNKASYQIVGSTSEKGREGYVRPNKINPGKEYTIISYAMFRRDPEGILKRSGADTLVFDEFHKARNESTGVFKAAITVRSMVRNFMGLTASLVNNDPAEVASLLTISEGKRFLTPAQFKRRYSETVGYERGFAGGRKAVRAIKRHGELVTLVDPRVDYLPTEKLKKDSMPKKDVKFVDVPMSDDQYRLYQLALKKLGPVKEFITRKDPEVIVKDIDQKQVFALTSHARQIANSTHMGRKMKPTISAEKTPKVKKILDDAVSHLKSTPDGKVVLYSNLIRGGVDVLSAGLKGRGVEHAMFVGKGTEVHGSKVTSKARDLGVKDFQEGKKKVIILSGAGAEGLNLPNATAFYALDGHFNPERIMQAEGRARRLGGQSHRLAKDRVVDVRRYRTTVPKSARPGFFGKLMGKKTPQTTDQWVYSTAKRKHMQNREFYQTIAKPHKYVRKYVDPRTGKTKYEYPKKKPGFFSGLFK